MEKMLKSGKTEDALLKLQKTREPARVHAEELGPGAHGTGTLQPRADAEVLRVRPGVFRRPKRSNKDWPRRRRRFVIASKAPGQGTAPEAECGLEAGAPARSGCPLQGLPGAGTQPELHSQGDEALERAKEALQNVKNGLSTDDPDLAQDSAEHANQASDALAQQREARARMDEYFQKPAVRRRRTHAHWRIAPRAGRGALIARHQSQVTAALSQLPASSRTRRTGKRMDQLSEQQGQARAGGARARTGRWSSSTRWPRSLANRARS